MREPALLPSPSRGTLRQRFPPFLAFFQVGYQTILCMVTSKVPNQPEPPGHGVAPSAAFVQEASKKTYFCKACYWEGKKRKSKWHRLGGEY